MYVIKLEFCRMFDTMWCFYCYLRYPGVQFDLVPRLRRKYGRSNFCRAKSIRRLAFIYPMGYGFKSLVCYFCIFYIYDIVPKVSSSLAVKLTIYVHSCVDYLSWNFVQSLFTPIICVIICSFMYVHTSISSVILT